MSLSQRSRTALFIGLNEVINDEEAVEEMLSQFPSRDLDEPATNEFVRAEIGISRIEMHTEIGALRTEIGELRTEMHTEIGALRADMHRGFQTLTVTLVGSMISLAAVVVGAVAVVG